MSRLTPEQKAQQIAADVVARIADMRRTETQDELDRLLIAFRAEAQNRDIAWPIRQHVEQVTYLETASQIGGRKKPLLVMR